MMSVAGIVSMCAFTPNVKPSTSFKYYGDIKPLNYFDPLNFLTPTKSNEKISDEAIKYVREAELQHGRMAMLAATGVVATLNVWGKLGETSTNRCHWCNFTCTKCGSF